MGAETVQEKAELPDAGTKGQKSRSGASIPAWFEGGQMPLVRRVPKRGPRRIAHKRFEYDVVNIKTLNLFDDELEVNPERLREAGIVKRKKRSHKDTR